MEESNDSDVRYFKPTDEEQSYFHRIYARLISEVQDQHDKTVAPTIAYNKKKIENWVDVQQEQLHVQLTDAQKEVEQYIRAGAQKTIEIIRDLDIVDSLEKFVAFENKSKLTNAKKLLKAKNSPVLQMKKNDLLENLKKHSRYKTMFKFEEDHIVISSQKEAAAFIKMLNDDIVRSELTGKEYDSSSKMLLGPVGASH